VAAALDAGLEPVDVLVDAERPVLEDRLTRAELVAPALMGELSSLVHPARVIGIFRRADLRGGTDAPVGVALWHVGDPGNVGTIARTADALGPAFVALSAGCADPTGPKALRASMGSLFRVPLARFDDAPRPWIGLVPRSGRTLSGLELGERTTFVVGAEREGLAPDVADRCDELASIPLAEGAESLNVAAAAAIALYELRRRIS
jgi:RNA methyltransferase, TrmH family